MTDLTMIDPPPTHPDTDAIEKERRMADTDGPRDEPIFLRIGAAAKLLGVSISTLRRIEKSGRLADYGVKVYYTPTHRRRYKRSEIIEALERSADR